MSKRPRTAGPRETCVITERACRRMPVKIGCWLVGTDEASCFETFDLSESGVAVVTSAPLSVGKIVHLQFFTPLAATPVTVKAEVIWSRLEPEGGMGFRFMEVDHRTTSVIREFVRELEKGKRLDVPAAAVPERL